MVIDIFCIFMLISVCVTRICIDFITDIFIITCITFVLMYCIVPSDFRYRILLKLFIATCVLEHVLCVALIVTNTWSVVGVEVIDTHLWVYMWGALASSCFSILNKMNKNAKQNVIRGYQAVEGVLNFIAGVYFFVNIFVCIKYGTGVWGCALIELVCVWLLRVRMQIIYNRRNEQYVR